MPDPVRIAAIIGYRASCAIALTVSNTCWYSEGAYTCRRDYEFSERYEEICSLGRYTDLPSESALVSD